MTFAERLASGGRLVRAAVRSVARAPSFSLTVALILALGLGLSIAVFTVADALLLRRLPVADQNRLVVLPIQRTSTPPTRSSRPSTKPTRSWSIRSVAPTVFARSTSDAHLISASHGLRSAAMMTRSVDEYVQAALSGPPRGGFREREIARTAESFGSIMQVFSTYESRRDSTDTHPTRGINSFQLFNDGHRWWVTSVLWDAERPNTPIPAAYLNSRVTPP